MPEISAGHCHLTCAAVRLPFGQRACRV